MSTSKALNAALHSMAAHLHRYKTELQRIELVLSDLRKYRPETLDKDSQQMFDREQQKIEQLATQLNAIMSFSDEMEKNVQNTLALVS